MKLNKVMAVMVVSSALVLSGCSAMGDLPPVLDTTVS